MRDQQCWQQSYCEKQHRSVMLQPKDWPVAAWHDWLGLLGAECQDTREVLTRFSKRVAPWCGGHPAAKGRTSTGAGCWQDRGRTPGRGPACCSISRWVGRKDSPRLGPRTGGRSLCMSEHVSGCSPDVPPTLCSAGVPYLKDKQNQTEGKLAKEEEHSRAARAPM